MLLHVDNILAKDMRDIAEHHMEVCMEVVSQQIAEEARYHTLLKTMQEYKAWTEVFEQAWELINNRSQAEG
jgi:hypothetical protein